MQQTNLFQEDFNAKYLGAYQQGLSDPTNKNHQFDSDTVTNVAGKPSPVAELAASSVAGDGLRAPFSLVLLSN